MRPDALEIEGFTSFAQPARISFEGAEYFVLVGPTGAGKSSIVDAMTFALYGSVPRYADERLVAPVISQGKLEARVRFDFTIGGTGYTVARVVRRGARGGASTKEARLQRGEDVLASGQDDVTAAVQELLGLSFDHFTKCVVLPQGAFARFLHDKARDRQQLLTELLDLGIYEQVMTLAHGRVKEGEAQVQLLEQRLAADAELLAEGALDVAQARVATIQALLERIDGAQPQLDELKARVDFATDAASTARRNAGRLRALAMPAGVAEVARRTQAATERAEDAEQHVAKTSQTVGDAMEAVRLLPERGPLERALTAHEEREDVAARLAKVAVELTAVTGACASTGTQVDAASSALRERERQLAAAQLAHRAADLARTLVAGEPCPVCRQPVATVMEFPVPEDLAVAERDTAEAASVLDASRAAAEKARHAQVRAEEQAGALRDRVGALEAAVRDHPDPAAIRSVLARMDTATHAERAARADEEAARRALRGAKDELERVRADERTAWEALDAARDTVAELDPPAVERRDLATGWETLVRWAAAQAPGLDALATGHDHVAREAKETREALVAELVAACETAGVKVAGAAAGRDAAVRALTEAEHRVETIAQARARAAAVHEQLVAAREAAEVARALHKHLSARGFEQWLLDDAVASLVARATDVLLALSGGQYSLTADAKGAFSVVDHRNADESRLVRTLSGGETFLTSLALALALADQIGALAGGGAARLESLFLDEGFGTLDPDTLDTVATTMENLAAGGRVVGIITHVRELADRVPVRFEVTKLPDGSHVERVDL